MAYKALYRKYRPETFETIVGQKHIVTTLQNAIAHQKIAHAYIFSGPRGTGKTTTAKILAKALNCSSEGIKPCNHCPNCDAINEGSHPDIIEIDAASNNGIDEVRDLIEKVKYAPIQGKYKVYIIDEVHMMTAGAFNALLKTLEEPPAHVVFILATTDVHKVLPTVLSRCQRFDFSKISFDDIKQRVEEILVKEEVTFEPKVSSLVAELADGGMRDALSILDQVVSYAGSHITLQHVYDVYGIMSSSDMVEYLSFLATGKTKDVLEMIESYIKKGIDVKRLTYDLMVCMKDAIVFKSTSDATILERLSAQQAKDLLKFFSIDQALKTVAILNEAMGNFRQTSNYRLFFELASLKIIEELSINPNIFKNDEPSVPVTTPTKEIDPKKEELKPANPKSTIYSTPIEEVKVHVPETPVEINEEVKKATSNGYDKPTESEIINYPMEEYVNILCQGDKRFKDELNEKWKEIKKFIEDPSTRYIAQLLADSTIGAANKEYVIIVCEFKLIANRAKERNNLLLIKKFINDVFHYDLEVFVIDRPTYIDITKSFFELRQANKLPERHAIPHLNATTPSFSAIKESEVEVVDEVKDATIELAKDLFGDALKIE